MNGSETHNDEMCNLYVMFYAKNGQKSFLSCKSNLFPHLFRNIPADSDKPLPSNPWLDAVAAGCVHKGISSCFISRQCSVVYFIVVVKLELSQEEHPARKKN